VHLGTVVRVQAVGAHVYAVTAREHVLILVTVVDVRFFVADAELKVVADAVGGRGRAREVFAI